MAARPQLRFLGLGQQRRQEHEIGHAVRDDSECVGARLGRDELVLVQLARETLDACGLAEAGIDGEDQRHWTPYARDPRP
jgi:hypothetical protein